MILWETREMWLTLLYALIVGASLGAFWDIIRIPRLMFTGKFELVAAFFGDILFFTSAGAVMAVFVFETCYGLARGYAMFGASVGFTVWRLTLGRLTLTACRWLIKLIRRIVGAVVGRIILPLLRLFARLCKRLWALTFGKLVAFIEKKRRAARCKREAKRLIEFCRTLSTKTEEVYYALYTNEHSGKAGSLFRVRVSDNHLRERTNKIQQPLRAKGRAERADRGG